ncbi:helix-turn-helix domain-containing protein [Humitalea sp. 24SJ18S-53]|uniref:helix-turn-helix domain-containing protein n=1 Tax=Humitalea sp. 24SJ18S-53 TaxID=3422307 RepID=UPI003D67B246
MDHQQTPVAGFSGRFSEADAFSATLLGGQFEYLPMPGQAFVARLEVLQLGHLIVQVSNQGAHTARGAMAAGISALIVPLRYAEAPARMNGSEVARSGAFLAPGDMEFHCHCNAEIGWAAIALPQAHLAALAELAPPPIRVPGAAGVLALPDGPEQRLAAAMAAAAEMAVCQPEALYRPGCATGLALSMAELVAETLTAGSRLMSTPRATREAHRVVRAAEDYLNAHLDQPIYRDQLCRVLGVSLRKLHDAFIATVGMSPQAYLKTRRLMLTRRALQAAGTAPALVKSVALAHGFWHLGHFARDYRAQFGECPSATLGTGGKALPHPPRRAA